MQSRQLATEVEYLPLAGKQDIAWMDFKGLVLYYIDQQHHRLEVYEQPATSTLTMV